MCFNWDEYQQQYVLSIANIVISAGSSYSGTKIQRVHRMNLRIQASF